MVDFEVKISQKNCKSYQMHLEKVTVGYGLSAGGIIGPYFFKDAANRNVTMNGERYLEMIYYYFLAKMQELALHDMWFQPDDAAQHA